MRRVLYSFRRCPYAIRTRMTLAYVGIDYEHREVELKHKPAEMLLVSPKGTVPVLVQPDGTVLDESVDIIRWALAESDPDGWLSYPPMIQDQFWGQLEGLERDFKPDLDAFKYRSHLEPEQWQPPRDRCVAILETLEAKLAQHAQLAAARLSLLDIGWLPFVRQFANVDAAWFAALPLTNLQAWLAAHLAGDLFLSIMDKHPRWEPAQLG
jgi:glutathione S-transferase